MISTDTAAILDPHKQYIGNDKRGWDSDVSDFLRYSGHAACFKSLGSCSVLPGTKDYPATLFRFPLRLPGADSEISSNAYPVERVRTFLYQSFIKEAPLILLFLKHVEEISLYDGDNLLYKVSIHSKHQTKVRSERNSLIKLGLSNPSYPSLRLYTMTICVDNFCDNELNNYYHWLIFNMIGSNIERIQELSRKLQILPWVGVASPLPNMVNLSNVHIPDIDINQLSNVLQMIKRKVTTSIIPRSWCEGIQGHIEGHAFCFLPLPNATHLPINVHGYFGVSDNRRSIEWPASDNKSDKAVWNQELVLEHVAPLYSILIGCRSKFIKYKDTPLPICGMGEQMTDPYAAWPLCSKVRYEKIWSMLVKPTIAGCLSSRVFWSAIDEWVSLDEAIFLPEITNFPFPKMAVEVLVQAKVPIVKLPAEIWQTLSECDLKKRISTIVTPSHVREAFKRATVPFNSFEEFQPLLECLLCDITRYNYSELFGLKIIPLASNILTTLSKHKHQDFVYFLTKEMASVMDFLPGTENILVDDSTLNSSIISTKLCDLAKWKVSQVRLLDRDIVCGELLPQSIQTWSRAQHHQVITWNTNSSKTPSIEWIRNVWNWLNKYPETLHKTIGLQILPMELINDYTTIYTLLPLPDSSNKYYFKNNADASEASLLTKLGAKVIERNFFVTNHIKISCYVVDANIPNLIEYLDRHQSAINLLTRSEIEELRLSIAQYYYNRTINRQSIDMLRQLAIYELGVGQAATRLISLETHSIILPPSNMTFEPQLEYPPNILNTSETVVHHLLSQKLNFSTSNYDDVYEAILKFAFDQCTSSRSWNNGDKLIIWVMKQSRYLSTRLITILSMEAFVRTEANSSCLKKPSELYNPNDKEFHKLFNIKDDKTFPANKYEKNGVLDLLFRFGLMTWANIKENEHTLGDLLCERACAVNRLSSTAAFQRSCNIMELIASLPYCSAKLLAKIKRVQFLSVQDSPSSFPSSLLWCGSGKNNCLEAPSNLCYHYDSIGLIGSVLPIISSQYKEKMSYRLPDNATKVFLEPTVEAVLKQLNILIMSERKIRPKDFEYISEMIDKIYNFLNNNHSSLSPSLLPKCWIWWCHQRRYNFMSSDMFVLNSPFDLSPFIHCIKSDDRFIKCSELLQKSGIKHEPNVTDLVQVLHRMPSTSLDSKFISMSIKILNELYDSEHNYSNSHNYPILLPTADGALCPAKQCTYDDREWIRKKVGTGFKKLSLLDENISAKLAKYFGVDPLSKKVAPSTKIPLNYTRTGQTESLTRRISGIVNDYSGNIDVFKELIQNADDAEATEIKLLIDWRSHGQQSLLETGMRHWQGPALIAYNNTVFSDTDFINICELAAESKMSDPLKTGRFGVGFCSCYSLTDVPSFLSRRFLTIFDPHTQYLGDRIDHRQPGMRIDMVAEKEGVEIFEDQFAPFKNLFGCNLCNLQGDGFQGTMFRFPLRSKDSPHSSITNERYDYKCMHEKIGELQKEAQKLLIFLKHLKSLEVYELDKDASTTTAMKLVFQVSKTCPAPNSRMEMIQKHLNYPSTSQDPVCINCKISVTECSKQSVQHYLVASAINVSSDTRAKGMLSLAELAVRINKDGVPLPQDDGQLFCFLPLPLRHSLPFYINGYFNVGKDRRGLKEAENSEEFRWNKHIISDVLPRAFEVLLHKLTFQLDLSGLDSSVKDKKLKFFYSLLPYQTETKGWVVELFYSAVLKFLSETKKKLLWTEANGGEWIGVSNTCFYTKSAQSVPSEIESNAVQLLISERFTIVECPSQWFKIFKASISEKKNMWSYRKFFKEIFIIRIGKIAKESRNKHLHFVLRKICEENLLYSAKSFDWGIDLLKECQCIPLAESNNLAYPHDLINTCSKPISNLYDVSDGRFPDEGFRENYCTDALIVLGMVSKELPVDDLVERARTVCKMSTDDGRERMDNIMQYLVYIEHQESNQAYPSYRYSSFPSNSDTRQARINALSSIKFLIAQERPHNLCIPWFDVGDTWFSPSELYSSKHAALLFSQKPILATQTGDSEIKNDNNIEMYLGIDNRAPNIEDVLENLNSLIDHLRTMDPEKIPEETMEFINDAFIAMYTFLEKETSVHKDLIYARLENKACIWQDEKLHCPSQLLFDCNVISCYPYLCSLSVKNKSYENLFMALGVEREASYKFLGQVLLKMKNELNSKPLTTELLEFVANVARIMSLFEERPRDFELFLPDYDNVLHLSSQLCCDSNLKLDWIQKLPAYDEFTVKGGRFISEMIPRPVALKLGAYEIIDAVLKDVEDDNFLDGLPFGQYEDLIDRLNGILKKYPADESIFKEFIQNADDAKASEIVFVLDHRTTHPNETLVTNSDKWKSLQKTPSLCIFNDRPFNEEDIANICKLGRGGKGETDDTIGRFGIGFNVAYHLTDCPMFVSFDKNCLPTDFCVFDPLKKYCPKAGWKMPGRRWTEKDNALRQFSDQFKPFLEEEFDKIKAVAPCFNNLSRGFTVFRLPLIHKMPSYGKSSSERTLKEARINSISELRPLVDRLRDESENMVLFMNNLKSISVFDIQVTGAVNHHFSSCKSVSPLTDQIIEINLSHQIRKGSYAHKSTQSKWLMNSCNDFPKTTNLQNILKAASERGLKPFGSSAIQLEYNYNVHNERLLFYFLPLKISSCVPVHFNAHFLVDDSRNHLDKLPNLDDWNLTIARHILVPSYFELILKARDYVDGSSESLTWYYSLFPNPNQYLKSEASILNIEDIFYKTLIAENPSVLFDERCLAEDTTRWLKINSENIGCFCITFKKSSPYINVYTKDKKNILSIGMPITCAPQFIFDNLCNASTEYERSRVGLITPDKVLDHLRARTFDEEENDIIKQNCTELLSFCLQNFKGDDAKSFLSGAPILLTLANTLDSCGCLFHSLHASLLPNCHKYFINKSLEAFKIGEKLRTLGVIVSLPVNFVSQELQLEDVNEPTDLDSDNKMIVKRLWLYLENPISSLFQPDDVVTRYFENKPIIPTSDGTFYPPRLGKCVYVKSTVDASISKCIDKLGYPTANFESRELPKILSSVLSKTTNPEDIICSMQLRAPNYNVQFSTDEVNRLISVLSLHPKIPPNISEMLKHLPLFETVDGSYLSLSEANKFYILPRTIPCDGLIKIQQATSKLILNVSGLQTEKFYSAILNETEYSLARPSETQFYIQLILPHIEYFNDDELFKHLAMIQSWLFSLTYIADDEKDKIKELLSEARLIDQKYRASDLYDPEVKFHAIFNKAKLPPEKWTKWLDLLRMIGLQTRVDNNAWLIKAKTVAEKCKMCKDTAIPPADLIEKSESLLLSLGVILIQHQTALHIDHIIDPDFVNFLINVSKIRFIYSKDSCEVVEHLENLLSENVVTANNNNFVLFHDAFLNKDKELAFLCRTILPSSCNFIEKLDTAFQEALSIRKLSAKTVVKNLIELSKLLCSQSVQAFIPSQNKKVALVKLKQVFINHYKYLDEQYDCTKPSGMYKDLATERCILLSDSDFSFHLIKPTQLVMRLPDDLDLRPFCYRVPMDLLRYDNILKVLDVKDDIDYLLCLDILCCIQTETGNKSINDENYLKVCKCTYDLLIKMLRNNPHTSIPKDRKVFLPSEDYVLVKPNELVCNDVPWIRARLQQSNSLNYKFLCPPSPNQKGQKIPPPRLGVELLSDVASEELRKDVFDRLNKCKEQELFEMKKRECNCELIEVMSSTFTSQAFSKGFGRLYWHEHQKDPRTDKEFCVRLKAIVKTLTLQCVEIIKTVVKFNDKELSDTENDTHMCYLKEDGGKLTLYLKHKLESDEIFLEQLAAKLNKYLKHCVRNEIPIKAILRCRPEEIEKTLNDLQILPFDSSKKQQTSEEMSIGSEVELDSLIEKHEEKIVLCDFKENEKVVYHSIVDGQPSFKIAKIAKKCCVDQINLENRIDICCDISKNGPVNRTVSILQVYKLLNTAEQQTLVSKNSSQFSTPLMIAPLPEEESNLHHWIEQTIQENEDKAICDISKLCERIIVHMHYVFVRRDCSRQLFLSGAKRLVEIVNHIENGIFGNIKKLVRQLEGSAVQNDDVFGNSQMSEPQATSLQPSLSTYTTNTLFSSSFSTNSYNTSSSHNTSAFVHSQQQKSRFSHVMNRSQINPSYRIPSARRHQPLNFVPPEVIIVQSKSDQVRAKVWLQQAKADYLAACDIYNHFIKEAEVSDEESNQQETEDPPLESESEENYGQECLEDNDDAMPDEQDNVNDHAAGVENKVESKHQIDETFEQKTAHQDHEQCKHQALVCFLCHDVVEKCIKGILYATKTGLSDNLLDCSHLISLSDELKKTNNDKCSVELKTEIETCATLIVDYGNKTRYPNYHGYPPRVPATAYTLEDAAIALKRVNNLMKNLCEHAVIGDLLGDLEVLCDDTFKTALNDCMIKNKGE